MLQCTRPLGSPVATLRTIASDFAITINMDRLTRDNYIDGRALQNARGKQRLTVHAECQLAAFLLNRRTQATDNNIIIGTSKYACTPCHVFMDVLSKESGQQCVIGPTHGKLYLGWLFPQFSGQNLVPSATYERMCALFVGKARQLLQAAEAHGSGSEDNDSSKELSDDSAEASSVEELVGSEDRLI